MPVEKPADDKRTIHVFIPDTQVCRESNGNPVPTEHLGWIGQYIVDKYVMRPNVTIIQIGDHWHMPSLSSYDKGKRTMEGKRYLDDVEVGNAGFDTLCYSMEDYNHTHRAKWSPALHYFLGNHEDRIERATLDNAQLDGTIGYHQLNAGLTPVLEQQDRQVEHHGWTVHPFLEPVILDGVAYCLTPDHKVLTADLRYVPLGDIQVGDTLVGFDEYGDLGLPRRYQPCEVLAVDPVMAPTFEVTLESGKVFHTTGDHRWLARRRGVTGWDWVTTDELAKRIADLTGYEVCRSFPIWKTDTSYDAGWLAGMFDGEGWLSKPNTKQGGIQLAIAQNLGSTLNRLLDRLTERQVNYNVHPSTNGGTCQAVRILGTSGEKLQLIGSIRADRLIEKFQPEMLGRVQAAESDMVVSIVPSDDREVIQLQTSTGTFIADGYAHHNCHYFNNPANGRPVGGMIETRIKTIGQSFTQGHQQGLRSGILETFSGRKRGMVAGSCYLHNEEYRGPQATNEWRGILVCYNVHDGDYDLKEVSLDSLCRRYEGMTVQKWLKRYYPAWAK